MPDDSVKICNVIIQEEEYYSNKQEEYLLKKGDLNSKYNNTLMGVVITCILFIILIIVGIVLLVIKDKKGKKNDKNKSNINIKQIISVILFIIACLCSTSSIVLGYFANKNKSEIDKLDEPLIDDKTRPCYSKTQKKLIADVVEAPKNANRLGLDMDNIDILTGRVGVFTYSEDSSQMLDLSGNRLKRSDSTDKQLSVSLRNNSQSSASVSSSDSDYDEDNPDNVADSTSSASASGGTTSQVDLLI